MFEDYRKYKSAMGFGTKTQKFERVRVELTRLAEKDSVAWYRGQETAKGFVRALSKIKFPAVVFEGKVGCSVIGKKETIAMVPELARLYSVASGLEVGHRLVAGDKDLDGVYVGFGEGVGWRDSVFNYMFDPRAS